MKHLITGLLLTAVAGLTPLAAGAESTAPAAATAAVAADAKPAEKLTFPEPILITDVGQGNSSKLIEVMLKREGTAQYTTKELATGADLEGVGTLVIGVGASTKGLGAAGLDVDTEAARATALLEAAKEKNIPVIGVHIGGLPRRGELSDKFNSLVCTHSTAFIVWQGGNEDGLFTRLTEEGNIPLFSVEKKPEVGDALSTLLKEGCEKPAAKDSAEPGSGA